jgi:transposase-like protein
MSAHQLHRMLGVTYKSAWFMAHRIREAMTQAPFASRLTGTVEVDETYIGGKPRRPNQRQYKPLDPNKPDPRLSKTGRGTEKTPVVALVQRDGRVYSQRVANVTGATLKGVIRKHVDPSARIMTDAFKSYSGLGDEYAGHFTVNHLDEYVRGEVHTNTAENFFSILKRGIDGVYHHVSEAHLPRYLAEFDFRYNNRSANGVSDAERTVMALQGAEGKRLRFAD